MTCLLDTGFLYSLLNRIERQHATVRLIADTIREPIVLPIPVITEVAYLLRRDVGVEAVAEFAELLGNTDMILEAPHAADYFRAAEIIRQYADARVDFVDAIIVAMAERLNITRVLTLDRRDFRMFRPRHCPAFELLP